MSKKRKKKKKGMIVPEPVLAPQMDHIKKDEFTGTKDKESSYSIQNIAVGDKVIMTSKYPVSNDIIGLIWEVVEGPRYMNGKRRVRLEGYQDWYPADGLRIVG